MEAFISTFNLALSVLFTACFFYQIIYMVIVIVKDHRRSRPDYSADALHRYAVLVAARNEEKVIGELVESIRAQDYPAELVDTFVIADNCTDDTARAARAAGAEVFVRNDRLVVGKSWALDFAINRIRVLYGGDGGRTDYDGYIVIDADNVIDPGFVAAINHGYCKGYDALTSYRNSKNYDSNWVSAGSGLWFLREAKFLHGARDILGTNCTIGGTGFMVRADIIEGNGGWVHHLMTEDYEFSVDSAIKGIRIGYCPDAIVYDEQPVSLKDSHRQRLRWAKGFYQILFKYGRDLLHGTLHARGRRLACYDMLMSIAPCALITMVGLVVNLVCCTVGLVEMAGISASVQSVAGMDTGNGVIEGGSGWFANLLAMMTGSLFRGDALNAFNTADVAVMLDYAQARAAILSSFGSIGATILGYIGITGAFGVCTTITEWNRIHASAAAKIGFLFTFPFYMATTIVPCCIAAFKKDLVWAPIRHEVVRSVGDVVGRG